MSPPSRRRDKPGTARDPNHIPLGSPSLPGTLNEVVTQIRTGPAPLEMRIGIVTAVNGSKVQTDATSEAWVTRDQDTLMSVGDRVWVLKQASAYIVAGRLSGDPGGVQVGTIVAWPRTTPPGSWLVCNGGLVSRAAYPTLFGVIGTTYGAGDGTSTFAVPSITPLAGTIPYIIRAL